ncbi:MAG: glycosyltransferase family 4 protein [Anaerolineae bacterium]|nr:glycosyltransferase family 4 protein [Anaerolineae bacterium]
MHVLLITTYFAPDQGAAATRLTRLASWFKRQGHQVTVLTTLPHYPYGHILDGYRNRFQMTEDRDGIRVIQTWLWATPSPKISRKLLSQLSFMLTALLRGTVLKRPDVVLIEAQPILTNLAGILISKFKRVPYVLNVSDLWPDHLLSVGVLTENHPVYRIARALVDMTYHHAAYIAAMSPAWAESIQRIVGKIEKIQVIYNGVDLQRFRPDVTSDEFRLKYGLTGAKLVTFIGTLATQYDFATMINAAAHFANRRDVRFVFIGGGSQTERVQHLLSQHPHVTWLDWIDYADIPQAWAASYITYWAMRAQPLYEGTIPAKWYEALASGVPIAAASEGIITSLLAANGAGLTVNCGDSIGLSQAIERLIDQPELHERCRRSARAYAVQHFDPQRVGEQYERLLIASQSRA